MEAYNSDLAERVTDVVVDGYALGERADHFLHSA